MASGIKSIFFKLCKGSTLIIITKFKSNIGKKLTGDCFYIIHLVANKIHLTFSTDFHHNKIIVLIYGNYQGIIVRT